MTRPATNAKTRGIDPRQIDPVVLYPLKDVASLLSMTPATLRTVIDQGKLAARALTPHKQFVKGEDILRFIGESINPNGGTTA